MKLNKMIIIFLALLIMRLNVVFAQTKENYEPEKIRSGTMDFNVYHDTRNFNVFTFNLAAQLSDDLRYFSLNNFNDYSADNKANSYYIEHNLRLNALTSPSLDFTYQIVSSSTAKSLANRLGVMWHLDRTEYIKYLFDLINLKYNTTFHLFQISQNSGPKLLTQIEHLFSVRLLPDLLDNRVYITGFADQNISYPDNKIVFNWVTETQLGVRIIKECYFVIEYRYNQNISEKEGIGIGMEYILKF